MVVSVAISGDLLARGRREPGADGAAAQALRLFAAGEKAGVRYYYVEQDYTVGSTPLDSLRTSRRAIAAAVGAA